MQDSKSRSCNFEHLADAVNRRVAEQLTTGPESAPFWADQSADERRKRTLVKASSLARASVQTRLARHSIADPPRKKPVQCAFAEPARSVNHRGIPVGGGAWKLRLLDSNQRPGG